MTAIAKSRAVLSATIQGVEGSVAATLYTSAFGSSIAGWTAGSGVTMASSNPTSFVHCLYLTRSGGNDALATMTITGLTVGAYYTITSSIHSTFSTFKDPFARGYVKVQGRPGQAQTKAFPAAGDYGPETISFTFLATATSHVVEVGAHHLSTGFTGTTSVDVFSVVVTQNGYQTLGELVSGTIELDEGHTPYATAEIVVALPAETYLAQIDPRLGQRMALLATLSWDEPVITAQSRYYDLLLHESVVDHDAGTLTLTAHSDEAQLIDGGNITAAPILDGLSFAKLRDIVNMVLARYSAQLEGTPSNDYTLNLIPNSGAETGVTTGWVTSTGTATLSVSTARAYAGSQCFASTATGSGNLGMILGTSATGTGAGVACTAGVTYTAVVRCGASVSRSTTLTLRFFNAAGTQVGSDVTSAAVSVPTTGWTTFTVTATAPATAVKIAVFPSATSAVTGNVLYIDAATLLVSGISEDMFLQQPGIKDWDFLTPLLTVAGLRLFCDEGRAWRLADTTYTPGGTITLDESVNVIEGSDTISLEATRDDGSPLWFSGCIVKYSWTDAKTNTQMVAYDVAGTSTCIYLVELSAPYPGPGAAAKYLAAATSRGRVQAIKALATLAASPGMTLTTSLPETPDQTGNVAGVSWTWDSDGDEHDTMTIRARDLVEA